MERKCQNCSATVYVSDHFCMNCGFSLKEQQGSKISVKTGKGSINIGVGNLPGATIQVRNIDRTMDNVPFSHQRKTVKQRATSRHTAQIRQAFNKAFDDSGLDALCFDYFPKVYHQFAQGMGKDHKIQLLLEHCCRQPTGFETLLNVVRQEYSTNTYQCEELEPLIEVLLAHTGT